jgi:hypothetical protein
LSPGSLSRPEIERQDEIDQYAGMRSASAAQPAGRPARSSARGTIDPPELASTSSFGEIAGPLPQLKAPRHFPDVNLV